MAPWCNRVAAAPTEVGGRTVSLARNFPDGSALHGQVYAAPWSVEPDGSLSIAAGGDGWPWPYACSIRVTVDAATVIIHQSLTNLAKEPMPAGLGIHPWFLRPLCIRVAASRVVPSNVDPDSALEPVAGDLDLRRLRPVPDDLDATWLTMADPAVELEWPDLGIGAVMRIRSEAGRCVAVASPASLDAVAVEPQTHAPQGLRRLLAGEPGGLRPLEPGASLWLTTELAFRRMGTVRELSAA
jgi:aldose 1-epimerase